MAARIMFLTPRVLFFLVIFKSSYAEVNVEPWGNWSECSQTCGTGVTTRTRPCPVNLTCTVDQLTQIRVCEEIECPVNGGWSPWTYWFQCTQTCGNDGTQSRYRFCNKPSPQYGGAPCDGDNLETRGCLGLRPCPVNGGWSAWGNWSSCSARNCLVRGQKFRRRQCNNPSPSDDGERCHGKRTNHRRCRNDNCDVDGMWSNWSSWTECLPACGQSRTRTRSCSHPAPRGEGQDCPGNSTQTQFCGEPCPTDADPWSSWSIVPTQRQMTEDMTNPAASRAPTPRPQPVDKWWSLSSIEENPNFSSELSSSADPTTPSDGGSFSFSDNNQESNAHSHTPETKPTITATESTGCIDGSSFSFDLCP